MWQSAAGGKVVVMSDPTVHWDGRQWLRWDGEEWVADPSIPPPKAKHTGVIIGSIAGANNWRTIIASNCWAALASSAEVGLAEGLSWPPGIAVARLVEEIAERGSIDIGGGGP